MRRFHYFDRGLTPAARAEETVDGGTDDLVQWTLTDHLNTVRDVAKYDPGTDMTTVVNHLVYHAFGRVTSQSNPAVDSLFLFTARPFDPDTGLQNNLNRWYDPAVGRWLSEDPIGFEAGDGSLYRYVGNWVLWAVDPQGLAWREVTCTFSNRKEIWSEQIAAATQESAAAACQRRARGWGLGTPWKVLAASEGALHHHDHGGRWESDYSDLRVTCDECQKDAHQAEKRCREAIVLRGASLATGRHITSLGEVILGGSAGTAGTIMVTIQRASAGVVTGGWILVATGVAIAGKGFYDIYITDQIGAAARAAVNRYCDCGAVVAVVGDR